MDSATPALDPAASIYPTDPRVSQHTASTVPSSLLEPKSVSEFDEPLAKGAGALRAWAPRAMSTSILVLAAGVTVYNTIRLAS